MIQKLLPENVQDKYASMEDSFFMKIGIFTKKGFLHWCLILDFLKTFRTVTFRKPLDSGQCNKTCCPASIFIMTPSLAPIIFQDNELQTSQLKKSYFWCICRWANTFHQLNIHFKEVICRKNISKITAKSLG